MQSRSNEGCRRLGLCVECPDFHPPLKRFRYPIPSASDRSPSPRSAPELTVPMSGPSTSPSSRSQFLDPGSRCKLLAQLRFRPVETRGPLAPHGEAEGPRILRKKFRCPPFTPTPVPATLAIVTWIERGGKRVHKNSWKDSNATEGGRYRLSSPNDGLDQGPQVHMCEKKVRYACRLVKNEQRVTGPSLWRGQPAGREPLVEPRRASGWHPIRSSGRFGLIAQTRAIFFRRLDANGPGLKIRKRMETFSPWCYCQCTSECFRSGWARLHLSAMGWATLASPSAGFHASASPLWIHALFWL